MATMDAEPLFVDTNILVYANVLETPLHKPALAAIKLAHKQDAPCGSVGRSFMNIWSR